MKKIISKTDKVKQKAETDRTFQTFINQFFIFKITIKSLFFLSFLILSYTINAQENRSNTLFVQGIAEAEIDPDIIILRLSTSEKENPSKASPVVNRENQIIKFLKNIGIDSKNFTIQKLSFIDQSGIISKMKVNKSYLLKVDKPQLLDTIIIFAMNQGMDYITIQETSHSRIQFIKDSLLQEAVKDAQHKANLIAQQLNVKITRVYEVLENPSLYHENLDDGIVGYKYTLKERTGSIVQVEKIKMSKTILVKFEIQNNPF